MNRRRMWPVVVFGAVVAASSMAPPSGADGGGTFSAAASSSGLRVSLSAPGYAAVQELTDFGFPVAQASVDSLGESTAFASYPYPGSTFLSGPGTLAGFTGQGLPAFMTYPFIAGSSYPGQPEAKVAQPGYELTSTSGASSSQATAEAGGQQQESALGFSSASAQAQRSTGDGTVTAESSNRTDAVSLAGALRIGHTAGSAKVARRGDSTLTRESSFVVEGLTVAGQHVGLAPEGFVVPGTTVPVPNGAALTDALARAGIAVRYLRGVDLPDGVVSAGMAVTWTQQVPNGPLMIMTLTFGQVVARALSEAGAPVVADLPAPTGETSAVPDTAPAVAAAEPLVSDAGRPVVVSAGDVSPAGGFSPVGESSAPLPPDAPASRPSEVPRSPSAILAPAAPVGNVVLEPTVNTFYSVLVFAALAGVLATVVLRRAGN